MRLLISLVLILAFAPAGALAQDGGAPVPDEPVKGCVLNPSPDCRYFGVTEIGLAFGPRRDDGGYFTSEDGVGKRMTLEGGVMRTFMAKNAAGLTWQFAFDQDDVITGPGGRYRRWLTSRQAIDVELTLPVGSSKFKGGTMLGLVRYSPDPFIGFSVRPERLNYSTYICDRTGCRSATFKETRVLVGGDFSGKPGGVLLMVYGAAVGVLLLMLSLTMNG